MKTSLLSRLTVSGLFLCLLSAHAQQKQSTTSTTVNQILSQFTLDEELSYIGGTGFFDIKPIPFTISEPINPQIYETDGPLGVRRNEPSIRFPAGLTMAATWDPALVYQRGVAMGRDTRARGYFIILGPGMDFYRVPMGGRNFEYMVGEDPYLGAQMNPPEIEGIQSQGVWACAKHYVCNDEEENRTNVQILVDERALREIYLPPFEASVKVGHVANVMGAYNGVNGYFCCENPFLLTTILKQEWGFKGILESDYDAIHVGLNAALAGCDVDLPSGSFMNQQTLSPYIPKPLTLAMMNDKVRRILTDVVSYKYLNRQQLDTSIPLDDPFSEQIALQSAQEGLVLLQNQGNLLPLNKNTVTKIAVIGNLAEYAPPTGFGSSYVTPINYVSELNGIQSEVGANTEVDFIPLCSLDPPNTIWEYSNNGEITQGLQGQYYTSNDLSGTPEVTRVDNELNFDWDIDPIPVSSNQGSFSAKWTGQMIAPITADYVFKVRADGGVRLIINGTIVPGIDNFDSPTPPPVGYGPTVPLFAKVTLKANTAYSIEIDYRRVQGYDDSFEQGGLTGVQASWAALKPPSTITGYNAVIIAAGISNEYEGEGEDRPFTLPEFQDELIQKVATANPQTVVVFHGGGNFDSTQWIGQVAGLIEAFYPGQDGGQALAQILFGDVNPSGKLPITMEKEAKDNPAYATFPNPVNQHPDAINYSEGIFIGYRGYDHNHKVPLFPFGFGLSYTTFSFSNLQFSSTSYDGTQPIKVTFTVTNTGSTMAGAEVAQLYVGEQNAPVPRPVRELKGFQRVFLQPQQSQTVTLQLDQRSFAYWNTTKEKWDAPKDTYNVWVGSSEQLTDLTQEGQVTVLQDITSNP